MRINNEDKSSLFRVLSDENMRRILVATVQEAKSASRISEECSIPLSSVYRYIHELNDVGLLGVERSVVTDEGKRYDLYKSLVRSINIDLNECSLNVDVAPREDAASRFYSLWSSIRKVK